MCVVIFPDRILLKQVSNRQQQYTTHSHLLDGEIKAVTANWCLIVRTWGDTPATLIVCPTLGRRHQHVAQCCRNIQPSFSKCLGIQKDCLGFKRTHRNVYNKYLNKFNNSEKNKIMIWRIHYFITKLKTKIDVIPRSCFNLNPQNAIKTPMNMSNKAMSGFHKPDLSRYSPTPSSMWGHY